MVLVAYQSTDAAAADGGLELAVQLLDCAGCIEALGQQNDPVQEEERSNAIDDILHQLYSVRRQCHTCTLKSLLCILASTGVKKLHTNQRATQNLSANSNETAVLCGK